MRGMGISLHPCFLKIDKMTKSDYFEFAEEFFDNCVTVSRKKNADYTGGNDNPFSNFESVEVLGIKTEQGFLTRMMDKMKRISSFVEKGELLVKDESVTDTLSDLANYSCLLAGYIESKRQEFYKNQVQPKCPEPRG
jgi:Nucleotide modification associated domain 1